MSENMFIKAARLKLRFDTDKGGLSVEDLWGMKLIVPEGSKATSLDSIAIELDRQVKEAQGTRSFVRPAASTGDELLRLKLDIVKYIIDVLVTERDEKAKRQHRKDERQKLLELINQRENEAVAALPLDELKKKLAEFAEDDTDD